MESYEEKLERERRWHTHSSFKKNHFLNSKLFYTPERNAFNYIFPKRQMSNYIKQVAQGKSSILIAPIGRGDDLKYLPDISGNISGIDVSRDAIDSISDSKIKKYVGDIKNMSMFDENQFDIVVSPFFFHHFIKEGFDGFLKEIYRVTKPGGYFFALEPNSLHPFCWVTRFLKRIVGNITGQVEDEAPLSPFKLSSAIRKAQFRNPCVYGASFSHNRLPIWIAKINNTLTKPLLRMPVAKYFAWVCLFSGRK